MNKPQPKKLRKLLRQIYGLLFKQFGPQHWWPAKTRQFLFNLFLVVFAYLVYLPFFVVEFAFHNDYLMLECDKTNWLGFGEAVNLWIIGRPLGAVLVTLQCHFIHKISDFVLFAR